MVPSFFRPYLLVVSKYLCCEMQVVIFRIVLHTDIEYGHMIYRILNYDLQTIYIDNHIRSRDT